MNVFYNFELDPNLQVTHTRPEFILLFDDFKKAIIDRLKILKDDIEVEEKEGVRMIAIIWPLNRGSVVELKYFNYSKKLTTQIRNSLSNDYIQSIFKIISDRFDAFNQ